MTSRYSFFSLHRAYSIISAKTDEPAISALAPGSTGNFADFFKKAKPEKIARKDFPI